VEPERSLPNSTYSRRITGNPEVDTNARWWSYNDLARRGGIYTNGERCLHFWLNQHSTLIPVHRKMYQLLAAGKLKERAAVLVQHLDDSESRLSRVMNGEMPKKKRNRQSEKASVPRKTQAALRRRV